jgi:hypothetical protein
MIDGKPSEPFSGGDTAFPPWEWRSSDTRTVLDALRPLWPLSLVLSLVAGAGLALIAWD